MQIDDKNHEDFNLDSFTDNDTSFESFFADPGSGSIIPEEKPGPGVKPIPEVKPLAEKKHKVIAEKQSTLQEPETAQKKKRTISDFEPDMDALLMTAQSSMIIEAMEHFNKKDFSSERVQIYIEALKGVDLYIKILNRNPNNYRKLKTLIDSDLDCQQVEKIAFDLYKKKYETTPDTDREKQEAFELFKQIFKQSANKASISKSMKILRKYFLLSGGLDLEKIQACVNEGNLEIKRDINQFHQYLKLALIMLKRGESELAQGLRGKDLNVFITKASELLGYYYKLHANTKISDYYYRIFNIYKKYYIVKE